eukprot:365613-Chlamydomonas_euryale.AAC.6
MTSKLLSAYGSLGLALRSCTCRTVSTSTALWASKQNQRLLNFRTHYRPSRNGQQREEVQQPPCAAPLS